MAAARAAKIANGTALPRHPAPHTIGLQVAAQPALAAIKPGVERWPVKTGTDRDVAKVVPQRVQTTVEHLVSLARPKDMLPLDRDFPAYQNNRAQPVETTIFTVEAEIIACKIETDGDFHLVIQGTGETMIAEVPDPDPAFVDPKSPWVEAIKTARQQVLDKLDPQPGLKKVRVQARLTGVGFFDKIHGQAGVARTNGIELHPLLGVTWL